MEKIKEFEEKYRDADDASETLYKYIPDTIKILTNDIKEIKKIISEHTEVLKLLEEMKEKLSKSLQAFQTKLDKISTIFSRYVDPENSGMEESSILKKDGKWYDRHVFQSQYFLQILKCSNIRCCKERRSSLFTFLPSNGMPSPIPIKQTNDGLKITGENEVKKFASLFATLAISDKSKIEMMQVPLQKSVNIPYDMFCPSVQTKLDNRTCSCGRYFSSVSSMKVHLKGNITCKKLMKAVKPLKILGKRSNEKLVLVQYDQGEEDVEWVYDMDSESDEVFVEPPAQLNKLCTIESVLTPIWDMV